MRGTCISMTLKVNTLSDSTHKILMHWQIKIELSYYSLKLSQHLAREINQMLVSITMDDVRSCQMCTLNLKIVFIRASPTT